MPRLLWHLFPETARWIVKTYVRQAHCWTKAAFIAFRLFDIWKPAPVAWADAKRGGVWVMMDDVIAGWLAALVVAILAAIAHLWLI